ncbi:alpha/beta fold hydrolase [Akkermansiaceae bacterium]|nr:alpha/beta fold hydrolase [Akkermansiaceae bacterium]MDB4544320.1 alpha/beta fold hydrolase [Akkermansiaceae bacterium]
MIHCLHGSVGCHTNWNLFKESLGEEINAIDLWSFFEDEEPVSLQEAGRLVAEQARPGDFLLGYSMGGRIALHALLHDPAKWRGAIIIAANPGISEGHTDRKDRDEQWAQLAESDWPEFLKQWNSQSLLSSPNDISLNFQHPTAHLRYKVARSFHDWSLGRQSDLRPSLPKITCPILWLAGAQDEKFSTIAEDSIARIPKGRTVLVPDSSHRIPWQQPEIFSEIVKDFVEATKPL